MSIDIETIAEKAESKYNLRVQIFDNKIRVVNPKYQFEEFLIIVNKNTVELRHHNGYINHKRHRYHTQRKVKLKNYEYILESIVDHGIFKETCGDIKMMDKKLKSLGL